MPSSQQQAAKTASPNGTAPLSVNGASTARAKQDGKESRSRLFALSLASLGIVYGDIGTSPLYAFNEALRVSPTDTATVLGILSIIFWLLVVVVSVKYLMLIMRADNRGEGGILALLSRIKPWRQKRGPKRPVLIAIGIFGAALLYGDGIITPAISVLSAVEGIKTVAAGVSDFVVPITVVILIALFAVQSRGTARVASLFGPIMIVWFATLGVLGGMHIWRTPEVLRAIDPRYAFEFLSHASAETLAVLGAVFLVVTGAEALYADMGHFGRQPIRLAWFAYVLPCLTLNYFGQGALVLSHPEYAVNPFYHMAPS